MHVYIPCDVSAADQLWCCAAGKRLHLGGVAPHCSCTAYKDGGVN